MNRVPLDKRAFTRSSAGLLATRKNMRLYVLAPQADIERTIDEGDMSGETVIDGYTTDTGAVTVPQPMISDDYGAWPVAYFNPGEYDLFCPDDPMRPIERWVAKPPDGTYLGTWNASTNTPTLAAGTGSPGDFYKVSVAGTQNLGAGSTAFVVDDFVVYDDGVWQRVAGLFSDMQLNNQVYAPIGWGPIASAVFAAATFCWTSCINIPVGHYPTLGRVAYTVGAVSSGSVRAYVWNPEGHLVASRATGSNQPAAGAGHGIDLDTSFDAYPGQWFAGLVGSSATGTFYGQALLGVVQVEVAADPIDPDYTGPVGAPSLSLQQHS